jgi:GNAT superfamily N-acetyltransferase
MPKLNDARPVAPSPWTLRTALPTDAPWIAELRAVVMRPDLERLGRWDPVRVRQRFLDGFHPGSTFVIEVGGEAVGVVAVRPESDAQWIEHFYLTPHVQGRGIGGQVLQHVMVLRADARPFRINVLQGSAARRFYERAGFTFESEDAIDVYLVAPSAVAL